MANPNLKSPLTAILSGVAEIFRQGETITPLPASFRLDGKQCLITGANSGLGFALAVDLAKRGAKVWMACRRQIPEAGNQVAKISGSNLVEMIHLDLTDLASVDRCCEELKARNVQIDLLFNNAAAALPASRFTKQGFEEMCQVNYLAMFYLTNQLLEKGVIPNQTLAQNGLVEPNKMPRIIFISSDTHRSSKDIDIDALGYETYDFRTAVQFYGYYKIVMNTYASELAQRLRTPEKIDVAVHTICPGPVNTNIIKEAPWLVRMLMKFLFLLFFRSPSKAAKPVVYLAATPELNQQTDGYLHYITRKEMDERCKNPEIRQKLWEKSSALLATAFSKKA